MIAMCICIGIGIFIGAASVIIGVVIYSDYAEQKGRK